MFKFSLNLHKMHFYYSLLAIILFLMSCGTEKTDSKSTNNEQPNILIILVDDLGKEWISGYGAEDIQTPHVDRLCNPGIKFHNVYSMPQCTPSRVTFLTGQYPFRHGWVNHWDVPRWGGGAHFDENLNPSIGLEMKKAGYKTCVAGKWQIDDFRVEPDALINNGFDEYCMWTGYETGIPASANRYQDPYLFTKEGSRTYPEEFGPDLFCNFIIDFIDTHHHSPMFIYFPMVLTHSPLVNTPDDTSATKMGKHRAMVKYADKLTGKIVAALDRNNVKENTVIIWTTDNGTSWGITGVLNGREVSGAKSMTTEPGINAPFIISWPRKIRTSRESPALIDFTDLLPTCLDLAGVELNGQLVRNEQNFVIDGKSFKEVLIDPETKTTRKWILGMGGGNNARLTEAGVENQFVFRNRVLRNEQYKLGINSSGEPAFFYDLWQNPDENQNLLDSLNTQARKVNFNMLYEAAQSFPDRDKDPVYKPNPPQEWDVEVTAKSQVWKK